MEISLDLTSSHKARSAGYLYVKIDQMKLIYRRPSHRLADQSVNDRMRVYGVGDFLTKIPPNFFRTIAIAIPRDLLFSERQEVVAREYFVNLDGTIDEFCMDGNI
jgi:hypothetical protein